MIWLVYNQDKSLWMQKINNYVLNQQIKCVHLKREKKTNLPWPSPVQAIEIGRPKSRRTLGSPKTFGKLKNKLFLLITGGGIISKQRASDSYSRLLRHCFLRVLVLSPPSPSVPPGTIIQPDHLGQYNLMVSCFYCIPLAPVFRPHQPTGSRSARFKMVFGLGCQLLDVKYPTLQPARPSDCPSVRCVGQVRAAKPNRVDPIRSRSELRESRSSKGKGRIALDPSAQRSPSHAYLISSHSQFISSFIPRYDHIIVSRFPVVVVAPITTT